MCKKSGINFFAPPPGTIGPFQYSVQVVYNDLGVGTTLATTSWNGAGTSTMTINTRNFPFPAPAQTYAHEAGHSFGPGLRSSPNFGCGRTRTMMGAHSPTNYSRCPRSASIPSTYAIRNRNSRTRTEISFASGLNF
jgi:hypothetical protein